MNSTSNLLGSVFLALGMASVALTGCDDPAKGKSKATTGEAVATTTSESAAKNIAPQGTVKYGFDQSASKVSWVGSKVTGKHDGGFGTFKGTVDAVDGAPEKSKVDVQIDADSITSDTEKLTGHLKSPDFFDVKTHPKATFVSTDIKKGGDKGATHTITGNLTIKGITKSVTFPATIALTGDTANVDAEFAINRRDFSLNYAGMP
ncbi:MAG: Rhodanese-like domain protein, partial [Labilithrix sp.]|nr:Rhodanese-like domain protein [Labilithrix sp.]